MSGFPDQAERTAEGARALLAAPAVAPRTCPVPGCGRVLRRRQSACSGRCRAALSRLREVVARADGETNILSRLLAARTLASGSRRRRPGTLRTHRFSKPPP